MSTLPCLLTLLLLTPLAAQEKVMPVRPKVVKQKGGARTAVKPALTPEQEEAAALEGNRSFAGRRLARSRGPLFSWEQERARVFKEAKDGVVFVTTVFTAKDVPNRNERDVSSGSGSGIVWDKAGHVVTNYHVVNTVSEFMDRVQVTLADGTKYNAEVIGFSPAYDVAVLHVFAPLASLKPIAMGTSHDLVVGQGVLAIGNPFGLDHSMSQGIVSALGRELPTSYGTKVKGVIQTDAAINPGNSGGPLLDSAGRLIGMNTAIAPATGASVGIGFAIPVDVLQDVVPKLITKSQLVDKDKVYYGFQALPPTFAAERLGIAGGVIVIKVDAGSPAERAGLKAWEIDEVQERVVREGDIIVGCRGIKVDNQYQLMAMMEQTPEGKPLELDVFREGKVVQIVITPGPRPVRTPQLSDPKKSEI